VTAVVTTRGRRRTAAAALGLVGALGLFGLAAPAQAAVTTSVASGTLAWSVSDILSNVVPVSHVTFNGSKSVSGGATLDTATNVATFVGGTGTLDTTAGEGAVQYTGSYTSYGAPAGSDLYGITIANPKVVVHADGTGEIDADVSSTDGTTPVAAQRVKVVGLTHASFVADGATATLTATPDWAGVLPAGSDAATALGITTAGLPVDGAAFSPEFLTVLPGSLRSFFYASNKAYDINKVPDALTATASFVPVPSVTASATATASGFTVSVAGTDFTAVVNPGDAGVYVAIAPSGGLPDVTTQEGQSNFLTAQDFVTPNRLTTGAFTSELKVAAAEVAAGTAYSVYTWQAHSHSNTTQDTETALGVLVPLPAPAFTANLTAKKSVVVGGSVALSAAASGTGVTYQWQTAAKGSSTFTNVAGATANTYTVKATSTKTSGAKYRVVATNVSGSVTSVATTVTVTKAKAKVTAKLSKKKVSAKVKAKKRATVKVTVKASNVTVTGKAKVTFKKKGAKAKTVTKKLKNGKVTVRSPKLKKGTYTVTVKYLGTTSTLKTASAKAGKLKVTK